MLIFFLLACSFHNTSILCKNSMMMHHIGSPMYLPPFLDKEIILLTQKILKRTKVVFYTPTPIIQCVPNFLGHILQGVQLYIVHGVHLYMIQFLNFGVQVQSLQCTIYRVYSVQVILCTGYTVYRVYSVLNMVLYRVYNYTLY